MSDANVMEVRSSPPDHVIPAPGPQLKSPGFERSEPQWMNYGDMIRILGTIVVVVGHVADMILYQSRDAIGTTGPGSMNWFVCNWWDAAARWAVPIYIMLSGSLLLDPNRVESPSRFYHKRLMRIGVPLVFWSFFFMFIDVYYTGWRATENPPGQVYTAYRHYDSLTTNDGKTFIGSVDRYGEEFTVQTSMETLKIPFAQVASVHRDPANRAGSQFAWSANSFWQWWHNFVRYDPRDWGGHTRWEWIKYLVWIRPQNAWINLLKGQPYMHMHFIFRIAGLYAFTPVLRVCLRHVSRGMLIATVATLLAMSSADSVANNITGTTLSAFARFAPFLGYYLAGYMLRNAVVSWKVLLGCALGLAVSIAMLACGTRLLVQHYVIDAGLKQIDGPPSMSMLLYDFLSPVRVIMALFAWVVLVNIFKSPLPIGKPGRSVIRFWANTTLGLYLIHPLFREMWNMPAPLWLEPHIEHFLKLNETGLMHKAQTVLHQWMYFGINATWPTVWKGVPFVTLLVYVPSLLASIIIMRIPYVRRIAG